MDDVSQNGWRFMYRININKVMIVLPPAWTIWNTF